MPDYDIRINTTANTGGAEQTRRSIEATTAAVSKLTAETKKSAVESAQFFADQARGAEQAAIKARVLANIKSTRAGSDSSGFGDNSAAQEARIQRRLAAQREETALTQQSIPVLNEATTATDHFALSHQQAAVALKQLSHEIPGLNIAAAALKNPYLAAAAAALAMAFSAKRAKDEAVQAGEEQQTRLSNAIDIQITKLSALKEAHEKTASAARQHKEALAELERQASGIDAKLAEMDQGAQRQLGIDLAGLDKDRSAALAGIVGLPNDERAAKTREINAGFDKRKREREQQALVGNAARLADADRQAKQDAELAKRAIPGAEAGFDDATGEAARSQGLRGKVGESLANLRAELAAAKGQKPNSVWRDRLASLTHGLLGRRWHFHRPVSDIEADIRKFEEEQAGFGAGQEQDADAVRQRQAQLEQLRGAERGRDRFTPRAKSASADVQAGATILGLQNQTAISEQFIASSDALAKSVEKGAQLLERAAREQGRANSRAEQEMRRVH